MHRQVRRCRCRSAARHDAAILYVARRSGHMPMHVGRAERTCPCWGSVNAVGHLRAAQSRFVQMLSTAIDVFTVHERIVRRGGNGMSVVGVYVVPVMVRATAAVEVMKIRVVDVDVVVVTPSAAIPRTVRFAPTQWEPAETATPPEAETKSKSTQPAHVRRPVERIRVNRPRAPTPVRSEIVPPAIVVWRKAPRLIAHPSPAPWGNIRPISIAVWSPVRWLVVGNPHVAVGLILLPRPVIVQVAIADSVAIYILRRGRIVFANIPLLRPLIQRIRVRRRTR